MSKGDPFRAAGRGTAHLRGPDSTELRGRDGQGQYRPCVYTAMCTLYPCISFSTYAKKWPSLIKIIFKYKNQQQVWPWKDQEREGGREGVSDFSHAHVSKKQFNAYLYLGWDVCQVRCTDPGHAHQVHHRVRGQEALRREDCWNWRTGQLRLECYCI